ncbi:acyl carrier protein [Aestuariispira ectoiniformans]|uniref:acyl carrier protein n=1 Tax=Aestuariispira ectoiniformans TaxID=2775080 RepID=UPI00223ABF31|nr:acyl carrier protein [Aestuariispira ectoiniformans]
MYLEPIREIAASVLYLDDPSELGEGQPLAEHGFSSIDYIDLCFEMKGQISDKITPENLWPFNAMATQQEYFDGENWTEAGWNKVSGLLGLDERQERLSPAELVVFFTPKTLSRRIEQILSD